MFKKMMNLGVCGRRVSHYGLLALAAFASIGCAHALAEPIDRPAYGLIVKLKDAPSHEQLLPTNHHTLQH